MTKFPANRRVRSPTYDLIMRLSVGNPMMTPDQIAAISGRAPVLVKAIMRSDQFLDDRATQIIETYGDKIANVRAKILDAAAESIDAIQSKILNPEAEVSPQAVLDAAEFLMRFVMAEVPDPNKAPAATPGHNTQINVTIAPEEVARARELQAQRAAAITVPAHPTRTQPALRKPSE